MTLTNLTTNNNTNYGTYINNAFGSVTTAIQAVSITGANVFNDNGGRGLEIVSQGAIMVNNVTAIWNGFAGDLEGVYLHNNYDAAKPQVITLTGYNYFLHNAYDGLGIKSYGAITMNNITAADNGNDVNNDFGTGINL